MSRRNEDAAVRLSFYVSYPYSLQIQLGNGATTVAGLVIRGNAQVVQWPHLRLRTMYGPDKHLNGASTSKEEISLSINEGNKESNDLTWRHGPETPQQIVTRLVASTTERALRSRLKPGVSVAALQREVVMFCMATGASICMEPMHVSHVIPRTTDDSVVRPYFCCFHGNLTVRAAEETRMVLGFGQGCAQSP